MFKKAYKALANDKSKEKIFNALNKSLENLVNGISNPNDHKLKGKLAKYRACHYDFSVENKEINKKTKNKWIIVYSIEDNGTLYLRATGTHNMYDKINEFLNINIY